MLVLLPVAAGCADAAHSATRSPAAPAAEFVVAAGDSAFWVTSDTAGIRVRGAPLNLAQVDGRFYEVFVVDNDLSYTDADLVGQSVYRRDLRTGDSVLVFTDSLVPRIALEYARTHPDDRRLGPDEDPGEEPEISATATIDLGIAHGPFMSYALHTDVERADKPLWHASRRGVIDLRTGHDASVADVVGRDLVTVEHRRDLALGILRRSPTLDRYHLDPASFSITTTAGSPAIEYALPGAGAGDAGKALSLDPIAFTQPSWWRDVAVSLPVSSVDGSRDVWRRPTYSVLVRYDSTGDAHLSIRDTTSREWPVGPVSSPATHIFWLDRPPVDAPTRHALARAFDEAAAYGEDTKVALGGRSTLLLVAR